MQSESHDRRRLCRALAGASAAAALAWLPRPGRAAQPVTVYAAASLQNALQDIGRLWAGRGGVPLRFSFAASGALARQIEQGAPAAIYASADEQWMDYLAQRGLIAPDTRRSLLGNRLVLIVPAGSSAQVVIKPGFDMTALLGQDGRWVTGDPLGVPVGRYAQQALTVLGVWPLVEARLVRAENVRVALTLVERGEARAGIVYESDARASHKVRVAGVFPAESHAPISYPFAIVRRNDSPIARQALAFLTSAEATQIWQRNGFSMR